LTKKTILTQAFAFKPCGTMIPMIITLPYNLNAEVKFVIKEDIYHINKAGHGPIITIRIGIIKTDEALGFLNMFMFNDDEELIYDYWLDYNNKIGRQMIRLLCTQERIRFEYRDSRMEKCEQFIIDNALAPFALQYEERSAASSSWNENEFDILKNSIDQKYPIYIDLWNTLVIKPPNS